MGIKPSFRKKKFQDMSREELLAMQDTLRQQLADLAAATRVAQAERQARGVDPTLSEITREQSRKANLLWMIGRVRAELKGVQGSRPDAPMLEAEVFQRIAADLLEPGLYQHILGQAREVTNGQ
jgi:ribosomal protein L29